jgi:hypothetical protein
VGEDEFGVAGAAVVLSLPCLGRITEEVGQLDAQHAGDEPQVEDGDVALAALDGTDEGAVRRQDSPAFLARRRRQPPDADVAKPHSALLALQANSARRPCHSRPCAWLFRERTQVDLVDLRSVDRHSQRIGMQLDFHVVPRPRRIDGHTLAGSTKALPPPQAARRPLVARIGNLNLQV